MSFFPAHTVFLAQLPLAAQRFHMDACMRLISCTAAVVFGLSKPTPSVIASGLRHLHAGNSAQRTRSLEIARLWMLAVM